MSFSEHEKKAWYQEKREQEKATAMRQQSFHASGPKFLCLHCNNEYPRSQGSVSGDNFLCDTCIE